MTDDRVMELIQQVEALPLEGNIVPHSWYNHIRKETGKPYLAAIIILSDVIYWYRPRVIRDEITGRTLRVEKRFRADKLQRSYQQIADQFGISKRQAQRAVSFLVDDGIVTREFRTITTAGGTTLANVMFLEPVIERLREITHLEGGITKFGNTYHQKRRHLSPNKVTGIAKNGDTYTEITTENTTEITTTPDAVAQNLSALAQYGVRENAKVRAIASLPHVTPALIHELASQFQADPETVNLAARLVDALKRLPQERQRGKGAFTEQELDEARQEALALPRVDVVAMLGEDA